MAEDAWVLGIEIGGTKLQLGIGRGQGDLVGLERLPVDPSRHATGILDQIQQAFPSLLRGQLTCRKSRPPVSASAGRLTRKTASFRSPTRLPAGMISRWVPGSASI